MALGSVTLALQRAGVDELVWLLPLQAEVRRRYAGRHNEPGQLATRTKIPEGILGAWYGATRRTRQVSDAGQDANGNGLRR